jgi:hypothetical protein
MKKIFSLTALVLCAALLGAGTAAVVTTSPVARLGPFYVSSAPWDSTTAGQPGGRVVFALAADSERIGNVVYYSANNAVSNSATLANYNAIAGVVVGGSRTNMAASRAAADVGTLAATANQRLIILKQGRTWIPVDTTTGGLAAGVLVMPSLVAGKAKAKSSVLDSLSRVYGKIVVGCAASATCLADINVK